MIDRNLPNKLTILRVLMIPIFIIFFVMSFDSKNLIDLFGVYQIELFRLFSAIIFVIASLTDYFDGKLARKYNLVSNFGKLMDPLADKMLVITALLLLTESKEVHFICTLIVILRELMISSIRLIALEQHIVIAASIWGKLKTSTQMIAIVLILFKIYEINRVCYYIAYGLFYISIIFVVISLIDYVVKSKNVFLEKV